MPPTQSLALAKNHLESLSCGGNSPLTHALVTAPLLRVGQSAIKVKNDVSRAIIMLLTNGHANVPMYISMNNKEVPKSAIDNKKGGISRVYLNEEVLEIAKVIGEILDIDFFCIDTEDSFVGTGISEQLYKSAWGTYHKLVAASLSGSIEVAQIAHQRRLKETRGV
jgi:magnesium chelatase subunit D